MRSSAFSAAHNDFSEVFFVQSHFAECDQELSYTRRDKRGCERLDDGANTVERYVSLGSYCPYRERRKMMVYGTVFQIDHTDS